MTRVIVVLWCLLLLALGAETCLMEITMLRVRMGRAVAGAGRVVLDSRTTRAMLVIRDRRLEWRING